MKRSVITPGETLRLLDIGLRHERKGNQIGVKSKIMWYIEKDFFFTTRSLHLSLNKTFSFPISTRSRHKQTFPLPRETHDPRQTQDPSVLYSHWTYWYKFGTRIILVVRTEWVCFFKTLLKPLCKCSHLKYLPWHVGSRRDKSVFQPTRFPLKMFIPKFRKFTWTD